MSDILTVKPLTRQDFAPYGDVLEMEGAEIKLINGGTTERFHALSQAEIHGDGKASISIFRGQPRRFPYAVEMMERHPLGSQSFYPLCEPTSFIVVDRVGSGINLEESTYPSAYRIEPQEQT